MNNLVAFSTFSVLCNQPLHLFPKYFYYPKKKPLTVKQLLFIPPNLSFWQLLICSLSLCVYLFWIFHINRIIQYIYKLLCIAYFKSHNVFEVHSCCSMNQYFISFYGLNNISLYVNATICLLILLLMDTWVVSNWKKCCYEHVCACIWVSVFNSFRFIARSKIPGSYGNSIFNFLRICQTVFHRDWNILHSYKQCRRVLIPLHLHQ